MPQTTCGFNSIPGGASGAQLLVAYGPTLIVDIGFDPAFRPTLIGILFPAPGIRGMRALVDTGAQESCIDSLLAAQLNLPIVDRRPVSGAHGSQLVNMHLAQIVVPSLSFTIYGAFAGVHLTLAARCTGRLLAEHFSRTTLWFTKGEPEQ